MRLQWLSAATGLLLAAGAAAQAQEAFTPTQPVDVVVHTGAGGGTDAFARAMITAMEKDGLLPETFTVINKQGGGSTSAMNYLQEKAGDAHTIAVFSSVWITDTLVQKEATVTIDQLTPIARLVLEPGLVVVAADSPYQTMQDFVDAAKASPGTLKQSGGSVYSRDAVVRYVLMNETGGDWSFVSFPSGGERVSAVLGGHVDMMIIEAAEAGELIRGGKLRALAQVSDERIEGFPDVPTLKEAGFDIPNVPQARGIVGPPDMPAEAAQYYSDLFRKVSESPSYQEYLNTTQNENAFLGADELGTFLGEYTNTLRDILTSANVEVVR